MEYEDDIDALYATYQSLLPMAEADSARLWQKFRLDWNYNSNRIEGNTLTRGETKALLEDGIKPIKMRKDILQMQSHDKAIDVLRDLAGSEAPLSEVDIRALHETALGENYWTEAITADGTITRREIEIGTYKQKPNMVLKQDGTEHNYAQPNEVPARMAETMTRLRQYLKKPDVPLHDFLAELHQDFIETHPFDDGNGRVVRLLLNYVCLHLGWPPVIIKSDKRSEYIASLESWNDGDERPFRELMKQELTWSLKKSIAAARGEEIEDPHDIDKKISFIVEEAKGQLEFTQLDRSKIANICNNYLLPAMQVSFARFQKFSVYFEETEFPNFYETVRNQIQDNKTEITSGIAHLAQKSGVGHRDYYLRFYANFGQKSYQITAQVFYADAKFDKHIELLENDYNDDFSQTSLESFCLNVGKVMIEGFEGLLENRRIF